MDQLQLKIHRNHFKYGHIFMIAMDLIHNSNIYNFKNSDAGYCSPYTELCESFFDTLIKEITYHNYILLLKCSKYLNLIENCIDKAIHLKNKECYTILSEKQKQLCDLLYEPLVDYLEQLKNQIIMHIEIRGVTQKKRHLDVGVQMQPIVKMQPIHPQPPIIGKNGKITFQKNFLDI